HLLLVRRQQSVADAVCISERGASEPDGRAKEDAENDRRTGIPMRQKDFDELLDSVKEGGRILRGEQKPSRVFDYAEHVKRLRLRLGKSQGEFAHMIRVPVATVRNWEQGRRRPHGA